MTTQSVRDDTRLSAVLAPATPQDRRAALVLVAAIVIAFLGVVPVALMPLPRSDGFIPAVQSIIALTDFITGVLLFAHSATERSRALLYLAWGYLFSAIVVVAQTLTFPGAFSATGLLGAGPQTAAWLYIPWHLGIPLAAIGYALSKARQGEAREFHGSTSAVIACAAFVSVSAALVVVWAAVEFGAGNQLFPTAVSNPAIMPA